MEDSGKLRTKGKITSGDQTFPCSIEWSISEENRIIGRVEMEEYGRYHQLLELNQNGQDKGNSDIRFISDPFTIDEQEGLILEVGEIHVRKLHEQIDNVLKTVDVECEIVAPLMTIRNGNIEPERKTIVLIKISNYSINRIDNTRFITLRNVPGLRITLGKFGDYPKIRSMIRIQAEHESNGFIEISSDNGFTDSNPYSIENGLQSTLESVLLLLDVAETNYHAILHRYIFQLTETGNYDLKFESIRTSKMLPPSNEDALFKETILKDFLEFGLDTILNERTPINMSTLRTALDVYLSSFNANHLDEKYLTLFLGLEYLTRNHQKAFDEPDCIIDETEFNTIQPNLKEKIKTLLTDIAIESYLRGMMYENIRNLNRIPIKYLIFSFIERYSKGDYDLEAIGKMIKMRNDLAHGNFPMDSEGIRNLTIQYEKLKALFRKGFSKTIGWEHFVS